IAILVLYRPLAFIHRIGQLGVEAAHGRRGVLDGVVIALVETAIAETGQVTHVTDLVAEQVGRTTGDLERAVETTELHRTKVAAQANEGVASGEAGAVAIVATSSEVDLLLDLEESLQIRIDLMTAFEAQARRVARQVGFGIVGTIIEVIHRYMRTTIESYIGHCHNRNRHRSTNSNRNQLLLHWEKLLRFMERRPANDMTSSVSTEAIMGSRYDRGVAAI